MPEPCYLYLSRRGYGERWQEFKDFFQDDELEVVQRPMRGVLKRFL